MTSDDRREPLPPREPWLGFATWITLRLSRWLGWLPWPLAERVVAALWIANGLALPWRRRSAWRWAACFERSLAGRIRLMLSVFVHDGRLMSMGALLTAGHRDAVRRRFAIEGLEHLRAARQRGGVLLLCFHSGPCIEALCLALAGHPVVSIGLAPTLWRKTQMEEPRRAHSLHGALSLVDLGEGASIGLYRAYRHLQQGDTVYLTADGDGQVAFEIPTPGAPWLIRSGWLALRRDTHAATCPVLSHWCGSRLVVAIQPPLPDPDPDPDRDLEACRRLLTPLIDEHVRRFPAQCQFREAAGVAR